MGFERKFNAEALRFDEGATIAGYASRFDVVDGGGDVVAPGAFCDGLARSSAEGRRIAMLWQHDPAQPIGIWDVVREDAKGLWVEGRLLQDVALGREAAALVAAGALDGLSIGYGVRRATRDAGGKRRLVELDLWEVSLVTFPMLATARVGSKAATRADVVRALRRAREKLGALGVPADRRTA